MNLSLFLKILLLLSKISSCSMYGRLVTQAVDIDLGMTFIIEIFSTYEKLVSESFIILMVSWRGIDFKSGHVKLQGLHMHSDLL